jgi:translocator protein
MVRLRLAIGAACPSFWRMTQISHAAHSLSLLQRLALAILPAIAASAMGGLVTAPNIPGWYAALVKPSFNPPNWIFGPVWTVLYIMMAYAAFRVLSLPSSTPGRSRALILFFVQMALNALWSVAFFGANSTVLGLVVIIPLLGMILATIVAFRPLDRVAALLLVPYAAWVSFATILNTALWALNRA